MTFAGTVLVAEQFVFSSSCNDERFKLFQITFDKKDGSIFLHFPYQPDNTSILSRVTLKAGLNYPNNINIKAGGKVTGHKIKFSLHPDGRAHFSQDSKIKTQVINKACKLKDYNGHLFTLHIGGIKGFNKIPVDFKNNNDKKTFYDIKMNELSNLKFIAYWYNDSYLKKNLKEYHLEGGPEMKFVRKNASYLQGIMIENTFLREKDNYYLFLGFEKDTSNAIVDQTTILFLGSFEHRSISLNHKRDTSFLALVYPGNENYYELIKEIGTVDLETPPLF